MTSPQDTQARSDQPHEHRLAENALGLTGAVLAGLSTMAPMASILFVVAVMAGVSGTSVPLVFLLATLGILATGSSLAQFARIWPSSGSFVTFVSRAIAPGPGLVIAIAGILGYVITYAGVYLFIGSYIVEQVFHDSSAGAGTTVMTIVFAALVTLPVFFGLKLSIRVALTMYALEALLLLAFVIAVFAQGGADGISLDPFSLPSGGFEPVGLGLALAVLAYVGFEGPVPLAEETRNPKRNVPIAVFASILINGLLYVLVSWAFVLAFANVNALAADPSPLNTAAKEFIPVVSSLTTAFFLASFVGSFAAANSQLARVIFNTSREGLLPKPLSRLTHRWQTPARAAVAFVLPSVVLGLIVRQIIGLESAIALLTTLGGLLIVTMYGTVNLALIVWWARNRRSDEARPLTQLLVPIVGLAVLALPLYYNLKPGQEYPLNHTALYLGIVLALAVAYYLYVKMRRPELMKRAGRLFVGEEDLIVPGPDLTVAEISGGGRGE